MLSANSVCQAGAFSVTNLTVDNEEIKMKVKKLIVRGHAVNLVTVLASQGIASETVDLAVSG